MHGLNIFLVLSFNIFIADSKTNFYITYNIKRYRWSWIWYSWLIKIFTKWMKNSIIHSVPVKQIETFLVSVSRKHRINLDDLLIVTRIVSFCFTDTMHKMENTLSFKKDMNLQLTKIEFLSYFHLGLSNNINFSASWCFFCLLLHLGTTILEPDFDLNWRRKKREKGKISIHFGFYYCWWWNIKNNEEGFL